MAPKCDTTKIHIIWYSMNKRRADLMKGNSRMKYHDPVVL